jgi:N-acetylmuramoyl-L-alanine amidase
MQMILVFLIFLLPMLPSCAAVKKEKSAPVATSFIHSALKPVVVIDAGHGGVDQGARAKAPFCEEKRVCLKTARLIKKYLDQQGYHVVMTRDTDAFVSLPRRVEIAQAAGAVIFVSIHFNSARNPTAHGIEVFFHEDGQAKTRASLSKKLASAILSPLIQRTCAQSRGVKKGNFYVIRETSMPAVIVEGGFISNPDERSQLRSAEYQEKIARGITDGIDAYFKRSSRALK